MNTDVKHEGGSDCVLSDFKGKPITFVHRTDLVTDILLKNRSTGQYSYHCRKRIVLPSRSYMISISENKKRRLYNQL
jgi:pSer/pThr/pTyr-binding forkhead associated (FHA) protein